MKSKVLTGKFLAALLTLQLLGACGSSEQISLIVPDMPSNVQAQSFGGVFDEIEAGVKESFFELDMDQSNAITTDEFGVDSPKKMISFRDADYNHDGNITLDEFMPDELKKLSLMQKLKSTADNIFYLMDKAPRDGKLTHQELASPLVSRVFEDFFLDYDTEKNSKTWLSKSEFENLFAYIASSNYPNNFGQSDVIAAPGQPLPAPVTTKPKKKKA